MADAVVLDTSAFLTLTGEEPGADTVQQFITDALAGKIDLHASFVSLTEIEYITRQKEGEQTASERLAGLSFSCATGSGQGMSLVIEQTQVVPLTRDSDGVWRVTGSRVTLDSIVRQFKSGAAAEQIQEDFPSLALGDIYAVIAYFLRHAQAVEDYLLESARAAQEVRGEVENGVETTELRQRLRQRRAQASARG